MSRLAQIGVFCVVLGGVVLFMGLFPGAIDASTTASVGIVQILAMLAGLNLIVIGAYVVTYAFFHRGHPRTLLGDISVRMGMTGMVLSAAAMLADALGFGSQVAAGELFGWVQVMGMLAGFGIAALGVLIYGVAARF